MDSRPLRPLALLVLALAASLSAARQALADQVIMKDGTVYKGKILIDTDKAILIGNPPFDPNSYLLQSEDIEKVIYEQYHPNPPAERKRGLTFETRLNGNVFSSNNLSFSPAASLYTGAGFRVHPLLELNGGIEWLPSLAAKNTFSISEGKTEQRFYNDFWQYNAIFSARIYPFYKEKWKTEPYLTAGYSWDRITPKDSGDLLKGSGWHVGFGCIRPLTTHIFLESRFVYESISYDTVSFLGQDGTIEPSIDQQVYSFSVGISYRL